MEFLLLIYLDVYKYPDVVKMERFYNITECYETGKWYKSQNEDIDFKCIKDVQSK